MILLISFFFFLFSIIILTRFIGNIYYAGAVQFKTNLYFGNSIVSEFWQRTRLIPASEGQTCGSFFLFPDSLKAKKWIHNLGSANQTGIPPLFLEFWGSNSSSRDQKRRAEILSTHEHVWLCCFGGPKVVVIRVPAAAWCVQNSSGRGDIMYDLVVNYLRVVEQPRWLTSED